MFSVLVIWTFYSLCLLCSPLAIPALSFFKVTIPTQHWDINLDLIASQGLSWNRPMVPLCAPLDGPQDQERFQLREMASTFSSQEQYSLKRTSQEEVMSPVPTLKGHLRSRIPLHAWLKPLLWKHPTSPLCLFLLPSLLHRCCSWKHSTIYFQHMNIHLRGLDLVACASPKPGIRNPPTWVSRYPVFSTTVFIF